MDDSVVIFWAVFGIPYAYLLARVMSWAFFSAKMQYQRQLLEICSSEDPAKI